MIKVVALEKKNRKGKVDSYLRFRGTLFGVKRDVTIRNEYDKGVATILESLINQIASYVSLGSLPPENLQRQMAAIKEPKFIEVFKKLDLIPEEMTHKDFTLGSFLDSCLDSNRQDVKAGIIENSTLTKRKNACKKCIKHFGSGFDVRKLDYGNLRKYFDGRVKLHSRSLVAGEVKILRMYFRQAVKAGLVSANPFEDITVEIDHDNIQQKRVIIDGAELDRVEEWLKDNRSSDYYIYYILLRYTGCRKNEPLHLKWEHLDFDAFDGIGLIDLPSPKTRKKQKASRKMPMFAGTPLRKVLLAERERQSAGSNPPPSGYVVRGVCNLSDVSRDKTNWDVVNPNTNLKRLIKKAGVTPWIKTCQNIRVTRENELLLSGDYRPEAVHYFIGHTRKTFESSYAAMAESDFTPKSTRQKPVPAE